MSIVEFDGPPSWSLTKCRWAGVVVLFRFVVRWRRHVGAHPDGHQHGGRKPTETSVTEFCYKRVNLSLEELKSIKIILFPMQELFR